MTALEALNNLTQLAYYYADDDEYILNNAKKYYELIENALKDLEFYEECRECFSIEYYQVREAFLLYMMNRDNRKSLKALKIIKEKNVNICLLKDCDNCQEYNDLCIYTIRYSHKSYKCSYLVNEEYDLLKEVMCSGTKY